MLTGLRLEHPFLSCLWMLSLVLSLGVGDTLRWRWGAVSCCWEPRPGLLPRFGSQIVPDLWRGFRRTKRFTCHEWKEEKSGVRKGLLEERLPSLISAFAFSYWNVPNLKRKIEFGGGVLINLTLFLCWTNTWTEVLNITGIQMRSLKITSYADMEVVSERVFLRDAVFLLNPYGTGRKSCHLLDCPRSIFINSHHLLH